MITLIGLAVVFFAGAFVENRFPFVTKNLKKIGL